MYQRLLPVLTRAAIVTAIIILQGCATPVVPLQRGQTSGLSRDLLPQDIDAAIGKATATAQFELAGKNATYAVRQFNLQTGSRTEMTVLCSPVCIPYFYPVPIITQYAIIQTLPQRSLLAWGTLEELSKDADPTVSDLMPAIKQRLAELAKSK